MSMTKHEIVSMAELRGFTLWSTEQNNRGSVYHFMDQCGINLWVDHEAHFRMEYLIPNSIFILSCPECSPFHNDNHFEKMYRKFKQEVLECWGSMC